MMRFLVFASFASFSTSKFYNNSGYHFLRHYGKTYNLFSTFLEENRTKLSYPKESFSVAIARSYNIRNYNNYNTWEYVTVADRNIYSDDFNLSKSYYTMESSFEYVPEVDRMKAHYYNNRLRFGSGIDDRFISIVFNKDPWVDINATIVFIGEEDSSGLGGKSDSAFCSFSYPVKASSRYERSIVNFCSIPYEIYSNLTIKHQEIVFNLESKDGILLKNVRVKRLHPLDRRFFNVSCSLFAHSLEDHLVYEYIMYYLMMGVYQHKAH